MLTGTHELVNALKEGFLANEERTHRTTLESGEIKLLVTSSTDNADLTNEVTESQAENFANVLYRLVEDVYDTTYINSINIITGEGLKHHLTYGGADVTLAKFSVVEDNLGHGLFLVVDYLIGVEEEDELEQLKSYTDVVIHLTDLFSSDQQ